MKSISYLFEAARCPFDYSPIMKAVWRDMIKKAQDDFKISFDLENDDLSGNNSEKDLIVPQDRWSTNCKFRCQLWSAGGDWQYPVYYFKCQLLDGYAINLSKHTNPFFIFIPGKTEGNYHLVASEKDASKWHAPDNNSYRKNIDPEPSATDCWKALKNYLKQLVMMEIDREQQEKIIERGQLDEQKENTPESV
jgi:hypothetical protein